MRAIEAIAAGLGELVARADCENAPEVILSFTSTRDMARFERALRAMVPLIMLSDEALRKARDGVYELYGVTYRCTVRQQGETLPVDNRPRPNFRRL